jgi:xylan 1,4-beta-xylosidase
VSTPLTCPIGFNAQHSPMGAFMSFTCGHFGTRGGIGLQIGQPGDQDVFVGVKDGSRDSDEPLRCLPFYTGADGRAADAFLVEQAGPAEQNVRPDAVPFAASDITRTYGWCTDSWQAGGLTFTIYSPFAEIPDPATAPDRAVRDALLPAVVARLVVDNTSGTETKTAFFALGYSRNGTHVLDADLGAPGRIGFAFRREAGVAAEVLDLTGQPGEVAAPFAFMRWSASDGLRERHNPIHLLGNTPGIGVEVPAGRRYALQLAIGGFLANVETTRLEGRYLYTRYYDDLPGVLRAALDRAADLVAVSGARDAELDACGLSSDQRFMIAHATHSYYGSTQLLEVDGRPLWVVNEGEYCMMNTLDLAVDHVFWELDRNPWVVRNLLDTFVAEYSYLDEVKVYAGAYAPAGRDRQADPSQAPPPADAAQLARPYALKPGGLSFCHDMGAHNNFAPKGRSSYELANLTGCFSYMTQEQLCNWVLTAACYVAKTRDTAWLERSREVVGACLQSMINRGGEVGFAQYDSSRCVGGQEITTYDSLDHSLAQTRNNVYIAVKSWATYRALGLLFASVGLPESRDEANRLAERVADVVAHQAADGVLPAVFEPANPGHASRILAAIEGCVYALYFVETGLAGQPLEAFAGKPAERAMWKVLEAHTRNLLLDPQRRNLFADGGIKLSSTSNNSWMSKIALFMHVARRVFRLDADATIQSLFREADAAHVTWQVVGSAYWACSDQIVSGEGKASRYYPRIVTSALWMRR